MLANEAFYLRTQVSVDLPTGWPPADDEKSLITVNTLPSAERADFEVPNGFPLNFTTVEV